MDFNVIIVYLSYFIKIMQQIMDGFLDVVKPTKQDRENVVGTLED